MVIGPTPAVQRPTEEPDDRPTNRNSYGAEPSQTVTIVLVFEIQCKRSINAPPKKLRTTSLMPFSPFVILERMLMDGEFFLHEVPGIKTNPGITAHNRKHTDIESLIDAAAISVSVIEYAARVQVGFHEFLGKDSVWPLAGHAHG
jgi:hypothetical protein